MLKVVFLGKLADLAGSLEIDLVCPPAGIDWKGLLASLGDAGMPTLADAARGDKVKLALNGQVLADKAALQAAEGDEIALLPPVSGGRG